MQINIPISIGELVDKITILNIKNEKILDENKKNYILVELESLNKIYKNHSSAEILELEKKLFDVNFLLWEVEDSLRVLEKMSKFDSEFIELARSVYKLNDKRFEIKNKINIVSNSLLREQKSYEQY